MMHRAIHLAFIFLFGFSFFWTPETNSSDTVALGDFVGSEACASCHESQYNAWKASTHGKAGGPPSKEVVIAPFDGTPMKFKDAEVVPQITKDGKYIFRVKQTNRDERIFVVDGVVGGGHMAGGGTQGFLSRFPDGTMRFLPFDYSRSNRTWFANTNSRRNLGWVPVSENISLADCGDWPPSRILGTHGRFTNCQECHGSQINVAFDRDHHAYITRFTSLAINCESCHGPGRKHVDGVQSGKIAESSEIGIRPLSTLDKDASLEVCFQCHAVKDVIQPGYLPGKSIRDHYSQKLSLLGDSPLSTDGRVATFAYQEGHLFSDCYVNGSMTCVDCHDPHSQGYRDVQRNPLPDRYDNRQCTGCHASKSEAPEKHSHHQKDSEGNRCVSCHMPYLQHPEVGKQIRFARSDHSIAIPRPSFDAALGLESACRQCHQDRSVDWLEDKTRSWFGKGKPHKPIIEALLKAKNAKDVRTSSKLLLWPSTKFPAAQFTGLALFFDRFLPGAGMLEKNVVDSLRKLAEADDEDISGLALATLHVAQTNSSQVKSLLQKFLMMKSERGTLVQQRWAIALGYLGDKYREAGLYKDAIAVYRKALEVEPANPRVFLNIGHAYEGDRDFRNALFSYRRSIELDSLQVLAYVNLGNLLFEQKEYANAIEAYQKAIAINPFEPLAYFNLGNVYFQQGREFSAIEAYRKAIELDPGLALGHFYLARALLTLRQYGEALNAVKNGLEFDPSNRMALQMASDLERVLRQKK